MELSQRMDETGAVPESSLARYIHEPLDLDKDQFRLLRILPHKAGKIQCSLEIFDRASCPSYAAVSYVWGSKTDTQTILVNNSELLVTQNLHDFFEQVGSSQLMTKLPMVYENYTYLWIDQITIDQTSGLEKNHQVQEMGAIFFQAALVISWLGRADENGDSDFALDFLNRIVAKMIPCCDCYRRNLINDLDNQHIQQAFQLVNDLFKRPYWKRVWIAQEVLLAKSLIFLCGSRAVHRDTIQKVAEIKYDFSQGDQFTPQFPAHLLYRIGAVNHGPGILSKSVVLCFSLLECVDPRDRVYGILGVADLNGCISVDYSRPVVDVFCALVEVIRNNGPEWFDTEKYFILGSLRILGEKMDVAEELLDNLLESRRDDESSDELEDMSSDDGGISN